MLLRSQQILSQILLIWEFIFAIITISIYGSEIMRIKTFKPYWYSPKPKPKTSQETLDYQQELYNKLWQEQQQQGRRQNA